MSASAVNGSNGSGDGGEGGHDALARLGGARWVGRTAAEASSERARDAPAGGPSRGDAAPQRPMPGAIPPGAPSAASVLAQADHENFPVATRLLPASQRAHLMALYGFARMVDDIGDEAEGDSIALLDWVEGELDAIYLDAPGVAPTHPLMSALAQSIAALGLPRGPFERLIEANRREHEVRRIATYDELIESCRFSAMPVGELVLHIFGAATPERIALSDDVCAGLQLVEHLQDVREDRRRGHIYLPQSDLRRFGVTMADLDADRPGTSLRGALMYEIRVARRLLSAGIPLIRSLPVRDGLAVALFVAGGRAALDAIERGGYDVLGARPRPNGVMLARALGRTLRQADLLKAGGA